MTISINTEKVYHYILIYILIISQGSVLFGMYLNYFLILMFILAGLFLVQRRELLQSKYMCFVYLLTLALVFVFLYTDGGLSVLSIGNIVSRFTFTYVVYQYNREEFVERFVNTVTFFSVISLITYAFQMFSYNTLINILPAHSYNNTIFYGGLLSTVVGWHKTRNIGLATEPGRYQVYLIAALYLLLFKNDHIHKSTKNNMVMAAILIITTVSAQSTTGFMALIIVLVGYILNINSVSNNLQNSIVRKNLLRIILIGLVVFGVYMSFTGDNNFIYKNFINKIFDSSGAVSLETGSGGARTVSILTDLKIALKNPLGMGYGPYQAIWVENKVGYSVDVTSCVGLTSACAALGFPAVLIILGFYITSAWKNKNSFVEFIVLILIFINTSLAQPMIYFPPMIVMFLVNRRSVIDSEYDEILSYEYLETQS